jgi:dethiobiotin synthetase
MANCLCGAKRLIPLSYPDLKRTFFITATDTGAGKTVLTALLAHFLSEQGEKVAAFKPVCSGGRGDARKIFAALDGELALDEINPWHYREAIAPSLAAKREGKSVSLAQVLAHIRKPQKGFEVTLVEGAGGLLSPIGRDFNSRDLILALRATPIIVAPDKLGVVNHLLLTLEALPKKVRSRAKIVLMSPARPDSATTTNEQLLSGFFPSGNILRLPWLGKKVEPAAVLKKPNLRQTLKKLF